MLYHGIPRLAASPSPASLPARPGLACQRWSEFDQYTARRHALARKRAGHYITNMPRANELPLLDAKRQQLDKQLEVLVGEMAASESGSESCESPWLRLT